jgi:hypothetical protein
VLSVCNLRKKDLIQRPNSYHIKKREQQTKQKQNKKQNLPKNQKKNQKNPADIMINCLLDIPLFSQNGIQKQINVKLFASIFKGNKKKDKKTVFSFCNNLYYYSLISPQNYYY